MALAHFTGRADGDLGGVGPGADPSVDARRRAVLDRPWSRLRQVHGARVVVVTRPGDKAGAEADASVSVRRDAALCICTADCAPIAFASPEGVIGAAHAGWPGLAAGVIEATVVAMRALGASDIEAALGPCVHPSCYEFGVADLDDLVATLGPLVRSETSWGTPAFDVPAAVRGALERAGASLVHASAVCTACTSDAVGPTHFSHRARGERERQALVVWRPDAARVGSEPRPTERL